MKKLILSVLMLCATGLVSVSAIADDSSAPDAGACHDGICACHDGICS